MLKKKDKDEMTIRYERGQRKKIESPMGTPMHIPVVRSKH